MEASSATGAVHRPGRGRVFDSIVDAVGDNADCAFAQIAAGQRRAGDHSRQAGIFQSCGEREGPHRGGDDHRDGEGGIVNAETVLIEPTSGKPGLRFAFVASLARLSAEARDAGLECRSSGARCWRSWAQRSC